MFKRDFVGAPMRKALLAIQAGGTVSNCEIPYRKDEKYWITSAGTGKATFHISFNFMNTTDISMARIMLLEFEESNRHVRGSIATSYNDKNPPPELVTAYPSVASATYTNGIISFSKYSIQSR